LLEVGAKAIGNPRDYAVCADFMGSATVALNTQLSCGVPVEWSTHRRPRRSLTRSACSPDSPTTASRPRPRRRRCVTASSAEAGGRRARHHHARRGRRHPARAGI